jgi:hypothetical protein
MTRNSSSSCRARKSRINSIELCSELCRSIERRDEIPPPAHDVVAPERFHRSGPASAPVGERHAESGVQRACGRLDVVGIDEKCTLELGGIEVVPDRAFSEPTFSRHPSRHKPEVPEIDELGEE